MRMRNLFGLSVLFLIPVSPAAAQDTPDAAPVDSLALARQYTEWLYMGGADSLAAHTAQESREGLTSEKYAQATALILERGGFETGYEETWKLRNGSCQYWRTAKMSSFPDGLLIRWVLDRQGSITGLGLGPATQPPPVDAETCE